nr:hypothetical protein GCM10017611_61610 [Rhodococcus wratislaviensis]
MSDVEKERDGQAVTLDVDRIGGLGAHPRVRRRLGVRRVPEVEVADGSVQARFHPLQRLPVDLGDLQEERLELGGGSDTRRSQDAPVEIAVDVDVLGDRHRNRGVDVLREPHPRLRG